MGRVPMMSSDDIEARRAKVRNLIKQRDEAQRDVDDELLQLVNEAHKDLALCLQEKDRLSEFSENLVTQHKALQVTHGRLESDHATLRAHSRSLESRSSELKRQNDRLEHDKSTLTSNFNELSESNTMLKGKYEHLEVQAVDLEEQVERSHKERKRADRYLFVTSIVMCLATVMLAFCWISGTAGRVGAMLAIIGSYGVVREVYVGTVSWARATSPERLESSVNWKQTGLSLAITVLGGLILLLIGHYVL